MPGQQVEVEILLTYSKRTDKLHAPDPGHPMHDNKLKTSHCCSYRTAMQAKQHVSVPRVKRLCRCVHAYFQGTRRPVKQHYVREQAGDRARKGHMLQIAALCPRMHPRSAWRRHSQLHHIRLTPTAWRTHSRPVDGLLSWQSPMQLQATEASDETRRLISQYSAPFVTFQRAEWSNREWEAYTA